MVAPPTRRGFGAVFLARGVADELGGRLQQEFLAEGVACTIGSPIRGERAATELA